jgi:hypothetical protein
MAKIARVYITKEFLEMLLRAEINFMSGYQVETDAPKDLQLLGLAYRPHSYGLPYTLEIWVTSETFKEVPEGAEPPVIESFRYSLKNHKDG